MFGSKICACLIGLEFCPVHKKLPHPEALVIPHACYVFDGIVAGTTAPAGRSRWDHNHTGGNGIAAKPSLIGNRPRRPPGPPSGSVRACHPAFLVATATANSHPGAPPPADADQGEMSRRLLFHRSPFGQCIDREWGCVSTPDRSRTNQLLKRKNRVLKGQATRDPMRLR